MITRPPVSALPDPEDPFLKFANEAGGDFGKGVISFRQGKYYFGDKEVEIGTEFVAHVPEMKRGWCRFGRDGEEGEFRLHYLRDNVPIEDRETLGLTDPSEWPKNDDGEPVDPYSFRYYLPIEDPETGDWYTFGTPSEGGKTALRDLAREYAMYRSEGWVLIVSLQAGSYYNKKRHCDIDIPVLKARWEYRGPELTETVAPNPAPPKLPKSNDMNDDIPFAPEFR
jgi:hypothetical protein